MTTPPLPQTSTLNSAALDKVRTGQKQIIFAILLNVSVIGLGLIPKSHDIAAIFGLFAALGMVTALILSLFGVLRLSDGLGYSIGNRILFVLLMFLPLVSLIILLMLNGKGTRALQAAGYKVGILGARNAA